ncbi:MAG: SCO1664 family protein [Chloroflexi bacterium]|jgi:uncharacterized repeat protein (TIGR03843 family)|nr:SCO1664 family protein [Chloroflexota bacterium]
MDESTTLGTAEFVRWQPLPWGSNGVWLVELALAGAPAGRAVYKPRADEVPLWDFPDGTLYRREYAAYLTCRALGWEFIPPTVIRTGPLGVGSLQRYIEHDPRTSYACFRQASDDQLQRIALFDYLTNNADRKAAHFLADANGRLWAIDHGLTFHTEPKQRTVLAAFFGRPLPPALLDPLRHWRATSAATRQLRQALADLLCCHEVEQFFHRLDRVLASGTIPEGRVRSVWW